ncbi:MAG: SDR family NAD(P)-dependent oxidoreductase [Chlorobi bacterium]|nr:SDR family NAD(P)-dependent oxidoreductase [Chlorobiota bacterium]
MKLDSILIVGATSAIAEATARELIGTCRAFVLAARNRERLDAVASDLRSRGADAVFTLDYDAQRDVERDVVADAERLLGTVPDAVLIAHAVLPRHEDVVCDAKYARSVLDINTVSVLVLCTHVCRHFEWRGSGMLAVISSVAADRGRRRNFLYAASKAALDVYLDGLRLRWMATSPALRVLTIKPGYVRTPMTAHLENMPLAAQPQRVGRTIARLLRRGDCGRRYIPWWWRLVMGVVRRLPDRVLVSVQQ